MSDDEPFAIETSTLDDALVLSVRGDVDSVTAPRLALAIELAHERTRRVVVDLGRVTFLDSSGINALLVAKRELAGRRRPLELVVIAPEGPVRRVLEITQLTGPLGVVGSLADALAESRGSPPASG
jgi:stage II sporulation protein AA (anti-sigma F factor antagonist)